MMTLRQRNMLVVVVAKTFDPLEVAAGRKSISGAGDHHDPGLVVVVDIVPDATEAEMQARIGGVHCFRAIDRHPEDAVLTALETQSRVVRKVAIGHGAIPPAVVLATSDTRRQGTDA
jgi:hypothetical protein